MLQEIPLTDDERAAVEEGVGAYDLLLTRLVDVPAPDGKTPRQIAGQMIPLTVIRPTSSAVVDSGATGPPHRPAS
jgi:hypothetical protein